MMRLLGVRVSGGSHAHISRQLKRFGIDTSHFARQAHNKGLRGERRTTSAQLLVVLPEGSRRTPGVRLKWALGTLGVPEECEGCGIGPVWRGASLILHVDHINGDFLDNRPPNLRLLCPNCHSQTATYAGRGKRASDLPIVATSADGEERSDEAAGSDPRPATRTELVDLFGRVDAQQVTALAAARQLGWPAAYLHKVRRRLEQDGVLTPRPNRSWRSGVHRDLVIEQALAHPDVGPKRLTGILRNLPGGGCSVGHGTISTILKEAGLNTAEARHSKLRELAGVA
ncbi:HNH endonuclease [Micromonospora sp. NPDC007208]|uniref:HNH endonuclease signature motif containing protein n=1 Tax=Micromonospora sp. NPDC007208 TaxID=3364236 RepID=UPI0036A3D6FC